MTAEEYKQFKGKKASWNGHIGTICGYDPTTTLEDDSMCLLMHRPSVKQEFTSAYKFVIDKEYQGYDCFWVSPNDIINEP